ncbi:MAG: hypothetical protein EKK36_14400 [Bradyrhizobiaceae bacterium]|nr:MAG: hypothetical protein EKK36_14400 [Bradyrhizobiaceae bacterium]
MRDIRDDLKQRVALLQAERDELQRQLKEKLAELDEYEEQLSALLALEERRASKKAEVPEVPAPLTAPIQNNRTEDASADVQTKNFERSILEIMGNDEDWTHAEIKEQITKQGWSAKGSLGRAIQGQLLSMKQRGLIDFVGDKKWRKKTATAAML